MVAGDEAASKARMIYLGNCEKAREVGGYSVGGKGAMLSWGIAGTTGESRRLEAVRIRLDNCTIIGARVKYRVHVQAKGWLPYVYDDQIAGTTGEARRIEAIQARIIEK